MKQLKEGKKLIQQTWNQDKGFSLVELMVAVSIMGGLSAIAVPKYGQYKVKAAHTEARATLSTIHTAQALYLTDNNKYSDEIAKLNITISPDALYKYGSVPVPGPGNADRKAKLDKGDVEFHVVATAKQRLASCALGTGTDRDTWCVDHDKVLTNLKVGQSGRTANDNGAYCKGVNTKYHGCESCMTTNTGC